jgi:uncharacterized protein (DUF2252 family)
MSDDLLNRADRYEQGRSLRGRVPREAHADLHGPLNRDAVAILAESDAGRVPELLPERYKRMVESPFAFLRGAAAVMATDLAGQPSAGIPVQACGDCHLMNFGAFSTPEDNILFDINDFDETLPGVDFTIDLKRLAASVVVAGKAVGMPSKPARAVAVRAVAAYRERMLVLARQSPQEVWHSRVEVEPRLKTIKNEQLRRTLAGLVDRARASGLETDDNFPHLVTGTTPRIADKEPTIFHFGRNADPRHKIDAARAFELYRANLTPDRVYLLDRYRLSDLAFKAVGVGSVGTFCCVGLLMSGDHEPLFLQIKEAQTSVLERLHGRLAYPGPQGRRVVEGQRMMQAASDIFLGWTSDEASGRQFYVRILKNRRLGGITEIAEREALSDYAGLCGRTLARAHARSCDPALIAGYMGKGAAFDEALASFALAYADQTVIDHVALAKAKGAPATRRQRHKDPSKQGKARLSKRSPGKPGARRQPR